MRLESLERFGWRFGLENIQALLAELDNPQSSLQAIHVAGSNGKGSTCAFMASFLKYCGYKVGLYTSPHLSDIRERFRVNGIWISEKDFHHHTQRVLAACQKVRKKLGHSPTHFEALTAIAFSWFREQKVDWVVLEVGLGGRLDATNVFEHPAVSLIAPVGLEHQDILGETIGKIATEKAGVLKPRCFVATIQYQWEALKAIEKTAEEKGALLWVGGRDFKYKKEKRGFKWEGPGLKKSFFLPSLPDYQMVNASLAIAGIQALREQGASLEPGLIQKSFAAMRWPGRTEVLSQKPFILLDGAHNPDAAKALADFLKRHYAQKRWIVLNGFLKDKGYMAFARILRPFAALAVVTEPPSDRREKGERVFRAWEKAGSGALLVNDWRKALGLCLQKIKGAGPDMGLLITGSLYLGGACRNVLVGTKGLKKI